MSSRIYLADKETQDEIKRDTSQILNKPSRRVFIEDGSWTVPDDVTDIYITACGGGGGGGFDGSSGSSGGVTTIGTIVSLAGGSSGGRSGAGGSSGGRGGVS